MKKNQTELLKVIYESKNYKEILNTIETNRRVNERVSLLEEKYSIQERAMGSGGTAQAKIVENNVWIQIGYGHGRHNYAQAAKIGKIENGNFLSI